MTGALAAAAGFAAILARVGVAAWLLPLLEGRWARLALALALAAPLGLALGPDALGGQLPSAPDLLCLLLSEAVVGAALGFMSAISFHAIAAAGRIVDDTRDAPPDPRGRSSLESLYLLLTVVLFFLLGGHRTFLAGLLRSYEALPVGAFPRGGAVPGLAALGALAIRATAELIVVALSLAAPVLVALVGVELALGLAGRFASLPSPAFSAALRTISALLVVALSAGLLGEVVPRVLDAGLVLALRALRLLG
jgi:flagellar biosynthesis protein FliR